MSEAKKPKSVVLAARTTQELTIDKESLARWAQDLVEGGVIAHGITKHEIEKGFCRYQLNYEQLAMLSETLTQNMLDKGKLKGFEDFHLVGSGKDVGLSYTMDLAAPQGLNLKVLNGPADAKPLPPKEALDRIKEAVSFDMDGLTIDANILTGGLQSLANFFDETNKQLPKLLNSLSPEDREEAIKNGLMEAKPLFEKTGIEVGPLKGTKIELIIRYDKLLEIAEKHSAVDRGFTVKRNGDDTASVLVDYRRIVDMAVDKAQALLAKKDPQGHSHITHIDGDNFKLTLSKGGDGSGINKLLEMVIAKAVAMTEPYYGGVRQAYGTLDAPKNVPGYTPPK